MEPQRTRRTRRTRRRTTTQLMLVSSVSSVSSVVQTPSILILVLSLGGCASLVRQTARATATGMMLAPPEQRIRDALAEGRYELALRVASSEKQGGPGD